jgi:hypothetical protein
MKRVWKHAVVGLMATGGTIAMAPGCTHDNSTLFVYEVLAPQLVATGQSCVYTSDPGQIRISQGTLDVALRDEYDAEFLLASQLIPLGDPTSAKIETQYFQVQGAVVRITDADGNDLKSFTRLASATIPPSTGSAPSYAPIGMIILDHDTILSADVQNAVRSGQHKRLVTYTRFFGVTLGGTYVESGEYEFPVDVCYTCLIGFSSADQSPFYPLPNCVNALPGATPTGSSGGSSTQISCAPGQDAIVDCSYCVTTVSECNGAAAGVTLDAGAGPG